MADIGIRVIVTGVAEARRNLGAVQADIHRLESGILSLSGKAQGLSGSLLNMGRRINAFGTSLMGFGRTLTIAVTAPIAILGATLIKAGIDFESAFASVLKTTEGLGNTWETLTPLGRQVQQGLRDIATETPMLATELAEVAAVAGQLGIAEDQLIGFTRVMAELGVTTNLTAEESAYAIARIQNIFDVSAQDMAENARHLGSALVDLGNNFATTEADILAFATRIAAAGRIAGLTEADILGIGAAFSSVGVLTEAGGTAVQKVLLAMTAAVAGNSGQVIDNTAAIAENQQRLADLQRQLEITQMRMGEYTATTRASTIAQNQLRYDQLTRQIAELNAETEFLVATNGQMVAGQNALAIFAETAGLALEKGTMSVEEFSQVFREKPAEAFQLFVKGLGKAGDRAFQILKDLQLGDQRLTRAFLSLAAAGDLVTETMERSNLAWQQNNALSVEAEKRFATVESMIIIIKNRFRELGIQLFELYHEDIKQLLDAVGNVIGFFMELDDEVKKTIFTIGGIVAAIGPLVVIISMLISGFGTFLTVIAPVVGIFGTVARTVRGLVLTFGGLLRTIGGVVASIGSIAAAAGPVITILGAVALAIGGISAAAFIASGGLDDLKDKIINTITNIGPIKIDVELPPLVPEKLQPFIDSVKTALHDLLFGKTVFPMPEGFMGNEYLEPEVQEALTGGGRPLTFQERITAFTTALREAVLREWDYIREELLPKFTAIALDFATTLAEKVLEKLGIDSETMQKLSEAFASVTNVGKRIATEAEQAAPGLQTFGDALRTMLDDLSVRETAVGMLGIVADHIKEVSDATAAGIDEDAGEDITAFFEGISPYVAELGQPLRELLLAMTDFVLTLGRFVLTPILDSWKGIFLLFSPEGDAGKTGSTIGSTLRPIIETITKVLETLTTDMDTLMNLRSKVLFITRQINTIKFYTAISQFRQLRDIILDVATRIPGAIDAIREKLRELFGGKGKGAEGIQLPKLPELPKIDIAGTLQKAFDEAKSKVSEKIAEIKNAVSSKFSEITTAVSETFGRIRDSIVGAFGQVRQWISDRFQDIAKAVAPFVGVITKTVETIWPHVRALFEQIGLLIKNVITVVIEWIVTTVQNIWNGLITFLSNTVETIKGIATTIWEKVSEAFTNIWNTIVTVVTNIWNTIKGVFETIFGFVAEIVMTVYGVIAERFNAIYEAVKGPVEDAWNIIKEKFLDIYTQISTWVSNAWTDVQTVFNNIKTHITETIDTTKTTVTTWTTDVKTTIDTWVGEVTGFFETLKNDVIGKFETIKTDVIDKINTLKNDIQTKIDEIKNSVNNVLINAWQGFLDWLNNNVGKIVGIIDTITQAIADLNNELTSSPKTKAQHALEELYRFLNSHEFRINMTQSLQPQAVASIQSALVPPSVSSSISTDNSIAVNISGVPIRDQAELSHDLITRLRMLRGL